jgi:hypothetical protein
VPEVDFDVRRVPELHANGHGDVRRVEAGGRDLIEKRLEEMMVAAIDKDDPEAVPVRERFRGVQSTKPGADDDGEVGHVA